MANEIKRYTLDITNVTENGVSCDSPNVTILSSTSNVAINCIQGCEYEVSTLDNLADQCITFLIECEDCGSCPAEEVTVCFCDDSGDCDACEDCTDGICVSRCPNEFCKDGVCVECDSDDDCEPGYICTIEGCVCPSGIVDSNGRCLECNSSTPLDNCQVCVDGMIVNKDCGTYNCNPKTGDCQECVDNSHCELNEDGRNCCRGGKCSCCEGYVFDEVLKVCVEKPKCTDSDDCENCEDCNAGICVPRECPDDYECNPETDECEFNPCPNTPCENGAECGPDCGCGDDGFCKPCSELDCSTAECAATLGCECVGSNCNTTGGCSGSCNNGYECGPGCTCYKGECVPCSNFPCANNDCASRAGCDCVGGACVGTTTGQNGCLDTFELIKEETNCDLTANLNLDKGCTCPTITAAVVPTTAENNGNYVTTVTVNLHKGQGDPNILPRLGDTSNAAIADNELPTAGSISFDLITNYLEYNSQGVVIASKSTKTSNIGGILGFAGVDTNTSNSFNIPATGTYLDQAQLNKVTSNELVVRQSGNFSFPNTCTYSDNIELFRYNITSNGWAFDSYGEINTDDTRNPRFTWYRSEDNVFSSSEIIRDLYIDSSSAGYYSDTLFGPDYWTPIGKQNLADDEGLLIPNRYYQVVNDCSCNPAANSDLMSFCVGDIQNLETPTISNCGTRVMLVGNPQVCDVNQDLSQFKDINGIAYDTSLSTAWNLFINGNLIDTFTHDSSSNQLKNEDGLTFQGYTYNTTEAIKTLEIEQANGLCRKEFEFDSEVILPVVSTLCETANSTITAKFLINGYLSSTVSITDVAITGASATTDGNYYIFSNLVSDTSYEYTATFSNGCVYRGTLVDSCCQDDLIEYTTDCNGDGTVDVTVNPLVQGLTITLTDGSVSYVSDNGTYRNIPTTGTYTINAKLNEDCEKDYFVKFSCCEAGTIKIDSVSESPFCSSDGATITVSGTPGVQFNLGVVQTAVIAGGIGNSDICAPFASNQIMPASGVTTVNFAAGYYEAIAGTDGSPIDVTFRICEATNPSADCDVTIEVRDINTVMYPAIQVITENTGCNSNATEWTLTLTTQYATSATTSNGNISFVDNIVTVTNIPTGQTANVTLTGAAGVCDKVHSKTVNCECSQPPAPTITGDLVACDGDPLPTQTVTNFVAGYQTQVSTDGVVWSSTGLTYDPPAAGTYYFRFLITATNCTGPTTTRTIMLDSTPSISSSELLDSCTKIKLVLTGNHIVGTTAALYNTADCTGSGVSMVNPQISGNVVTYTVPASTTLDTTSWSVQYGECSCELLDNSTAGCDLDCDCVVELTEADDNCNLDLEMNGSGCGTYDLIEIYGDNDPDELVFDANNPTDNYQEVIGPDGDFPSLIPLVDGVTYTVTVSGTGCASKTSQHTLDCSCDGVVPAFSWGGDALCEISDACVEDTESPFFTLVPPGCNQQLGDLCAPTGNEYFISVSGVTSAEYEGVSVTQIEGDTADVVVTADEDEILIDLVALSSVSASCDSLKFRIDYTVCGTDYPVYVRFIGCSNQGLI